MVVQGDGEAIVIAETPDNSPPISASIRGGPGRGDLIDFIVGKKSLDAWLIPYYHTGQQQAIMGQL